MRLKLKHLRHPLRTANVARALVADRWKRRTFVNRGERRFATDPRYDLQKVREGFAAQVGSPNFDESETDSGKNDASLLERICIAYNKSLEQERRAPKAYCATAWWDQQRQLSLRPAIRALTEGDVPALRRMYGNFYRDSCSAGLLVAQASAKEYLGATVQDFHRRMYLIDTLYRVDHWKASTGGRFTVGALAGPAIGNPFGVVIEGTLVPIGAEYQHYCAYRISSLIDAKRPTVAEIGGGFGGMAYYLLRDRPGTTYIDFDVPESIALTTYFLLKAFPQLKVLLYGEKDLTQESISSADVVLMPLFEMALMPAKCADITFSSHAMSDLAPAAAVHYLHNIAKTTGKYFVFVGNGHSGRELSALVARQYPSMKLQEMRASGWHDHRVQKVDEVECVFRVCAE